MNKPFKSISWRIWSVMARIIGVLFILVFLINFIVIRNINDEFVFERLKELAEDIEYSKRHSLPIYVEDDKHWINSITIEEINNQWNITANHTVKERLGQNLSENTTIQKMVDRITQDRTVTQGKVKKYLDSYFYYVIWNENQTNAQIYFTFIKDVFFSWKLLGPVILLLIVSFIAARVATTRIVKPIKELESFAGEISKRNWNAQVPTIQSDEIGYLTIALEKMRDSLKSAEEKDRKFLQSVSHDLKTPVMIIKGYSQAIIDGVGIDSLDSAVSVIKKESERLERRITQLLRFNTLDYTLKSRDQREIIRIDRLIKSLVTKLKVIRPELNWDLNLQEVEFTGDSEAILIAFENLFENQLRYALSTVKVDIYVNDKLKITISNDGEQFRIENQNELFDAHKKDKDGNFGLGLAIVKRVIVAHGGAINAYNIYNGVEFVVIFNSGYSIV